MFILHKPPEQHCDAAVLGYVKIKTPAGCLVVAFGTPGLANRFRADSQLDDDYVVRTVVEARTIDASLCAEPRVFLIRDEAAYETWMKDRTRFPYQDHIREVD